MRPCHKRLFVCKHKPLVLRGDQPFLLAGHSLIHGAIALINVVACCADVEVCCVGGCCRSLTLDPPQCGLRQQFFVRQIPIIPSMPRRLITSVSLRNTFRFLDGKTLIKQNLLACKVLKKLVCFVLAPKITLQLNTCKLF